MYGQKIIKKLLIYISLITTLFIFPSIVLAALETWNLNIDTNYTLSNPNTTKVTSGVGKLKMLLEHQGSISNGNGGALLDQTQGIQIVGNYAYLSTRTSNALEIVDISNPVNPTHVGSISDGGAVNLRRAQDLVVDGNYAYITSNRDDAVEIIDISNPTNPSHVSSIVRSRNIQLNGAIGIEKVGDLIYVTANIDDGLEIINISDPTNPSHVGALTDGTRLNGAEDIKIVGNYAYITAENDNSFQVIDISNPSNPVFVGQLTDGTGGANLNGASGIAINGNYAYIAANAGNAIEVIDISTPSNPIHAGLIVNGGNTLLDGPENIVIDGNYAFITSTVSDAIEVVDISDPYNPIHFTSVSNGGNILLNGAKDLKKVGDYIYIASDKSDALEILKIGYDNTSPNIIANKPLVYSGSIDLLSFEYGANNQGQITFQISKDNGNTWYYLNGSTRNTTNLGVENSNTPAEINYEIQTFNGLAGGTGEFKWKAFLTGDGTQKVELNKVDVNSTSEGVNTIIDFETPGGYTVSQGTWTRQSTTIYEGSFTIEADNGGVNNSISCFDVDKTIYNDSTISFYKSVDSEANYDFLRFYINGVQQVEWSGNIGWSQENYDIGNGNYNFRWCYEKDGSVNNGADTAWVDYIEIVEKPITPPPVITTIIDFETPDGYTVNQGIWNRQINTVYEGSYSAEADNQGVHNSQSCFEATRDLANDSTISFYKSVSSEANYDFLRFYVDNGLTGQWAGNIAWGKEEYHITAGNHTFKWCYEKDASVSNLSDTAWIDYIMIAEDPNPPVEVPVLDFEIDGGYTVTTAVTTPGPDWIRQTSEKYEGSYSIESQNNGIANSSSCFERVQTVTAADTGIAFYKKVNSIASRPDRDHLIFYIDGVEQTRWSGSSGRSREIYNLSPNTYTLKWCYVKNDSGDDPIDKAWIDLVSVTQDSPILTEVNPVNTPTNDNTPSYTFNSPIAGNIVYGGSCSSTTDKATIGNNNIVFNSLIDGIYTDCTIQVQGTNHNSTILSVTNFTIDTTRITNTINYPVDTTTIANKSFLFDVSYSDDNGVDTSSIVITLHKFDNGLGSYGSDIASSYVDFAGATIGGTGALYPVSQLGYGKYKIDFTIADTLGNDSTSTTEFTIDQEPLELVTTVNNSGGGTFSYEFTVENITSDNITDWIIGFQLDNGTITTSSGGTFTNNGNLFEVRSNSSSTDTFMPGQTHTISFSGTGDGIVTDLYLIGYTNISPAVPIDYNLVEGLLEVNVTTDSINGNEYCRNVALTNTGTEDISNWQIQFDLDGTVHTTSNGTFSQNGITHTIDPLGNANITVGSTENIKFCTTGLTVDNNWVITLVTGSSGDTIAPTISSTYPTDSLTLTGGTFDFEFNYSDNVGGDGIDVNSDEITLHKWDGSAYGGDIAPTNMFLGSKTVTTTKATYPSNNITDGQYKVIFKIYDLSNNFTTVSVEFYVGITPSDTTPPTISSTNYSSGTLLPGGNHNIIINYEDLESGINTNSDNILLYKWDGISSWGSNIATTGFDLGSKTITTTSATYPTNNLGFGKYKFIFSIGDNDGNNSQVESVFYIDEVELTVSTGSIDLGILNKDINNFSPEFNVTVKTIGAGFDLILNTQNLLEQYSGIQILNWDGTNGYGYDKNPYTNNINLINTNQIIANELENINTDGNKNTYIYYLKLGANTHEQQAAGSYTGSIKIGLDLDY